jgi:TonB family protein
MSLMLFAAMLAATATPEAAANPRFCSPNGDYCLVIRSYRALGDFERLSWDDYWKMLEALPEPDESPSPPPQMRAALYRFWPGDYHELLAEFAFGSGEQWEHVLVADDGHVVNYGPLRCDPKAELLTIRAADGSIIRTLHAREALTANDHQWLCRGEENDVRFALDGALRMTVLTTDGPWDAPDARHHTIDIDLATGAVAAPERNYCPAALLAIPEADERLPATRKEADVVPVSSAALLAGAVVRVLPEYPEVAARARISGKVGVQVVVGRDGKVETAQIVKPLPFGLDQAVMQAIMKWEFPPAASRVSGVLAFRFEIVRQLRVQPTIVVN